MESIIFFVCFYIIGMVFALMIYNVEVYEKFNGRLLILKKEDLIGYTRILLSWIYIIYKVYKFIKINNYEDN
jgi:hypothetical protein